MTRNAACLRLSVQYDNLFDTEASETGSGNKTGGSTTDNHDICGLGPHSYSTPSRSDGLLASFAANHAVT
jgi:hypothetical protein